MLFDIRTYLDGRELLAATIERYIDGCDRNQGRDKKHHVMLAFVSSGEGGGTGKHFPESPKAADLMQILRFRWYGGFYTTDVPARIFESIPAG